MTLRAHTASHADDEYNGCTDSGGRITLLNAVRVVAVESMRRMLRGDGANDDADDVHRGCPTSHRSP